METGLINFFAVEECGLYTSYKSNREHKYIQVDEFFTFFKDWCSGIPFSETIPYDPESYKGRLHILCKSIDKNVETGDYVVVLWQSFGDDAGGIGSVKRGALVGNNPADSKKIKATIRGEELIIGKPMYYWVIPELNLIASIQFPHSTLDTAEACTYFKRVMDYKINHPLKVNEKLTNEELRDPKKSSVISSVRRVKFVDKDSNRSLYFGFKLSTKTITAESVNFDTLASTTKKIVVRDIISSVKQTKDDSFFHIFDKIREVKAQSKIEIREEVSLSAIEVEKIIQAYQKELLGKKNNWCDVGFIDDDSEAVNWLSSYNPKSRIRMNGLVADSAYYDAVTLLSTLTRERENLLRGLNKISPQKAVENLA